MKMKPELPYIDNSGPNQNQNHDPDPDPNRYQDLKTIPFIIPVRFSPNHLFIVVTASIGIVENLIVLIKHPTRTSKVPNPQGP